MSKSSNPQLEFFIKLTEIIGRTFTDLQQLLSTELKRQQLCNHLHQHSEQNIALQLSHNIPSLPPVENQIGKKAIEAQEPQSESQQQKRAQISNFKKRKIKKAKNIQKKQLPKKRKQRAKKVPLDGRPMPPLNAFMLYLKQNKQQIMKKRPDLSPSEVSTYASTVWNSLNEEDKEKYKQIYRKNHEIYVEEMKQFKSKQKTNSSPKKANQKRMVTIKTHLRPNRRIRRMIRRSGEQQIICLQSDEQQKKQNQDQNDQI